jgi:hypothetical protein
MTGFRICSADVGHRLLEEGYQVRWIHKTDREIIFDALDDFSCWARYWWKEVQKEQERISRSSDTYHSSHSHVRWLQGQFAATMCAAATLAVNFGIATDLYDREGKLASFRAQQGKISGREAKSLSQTVAAEQATREPDQGGEICAPGETPGSSTNLQEVAA